MSKLIETNELITYVRTEIRNNDPKASFHILCDIAKSLAIIADEMEKRNKK